jgi:DNA helicase-2/ATP-dependent DNA helicase PcrA
MKRAVQDLGLEPRRFPPRALLSAVSSAKSELLTAQALAGRARQYWDEVVARAYERYQELLGENHALDFDDLLMQMVTLLRQAEAVRQRLQERFLHVLIDEFQDTNPAQYVMARLLAEGHRNLTVVGDPDQSIYSWRAADIRNLLNFEHDYPDATVVFLEQNYRSTQSILQLAQQVISSNRQRKPITLWTENGSGLPATLIEAYDEVEEAEAVAREVLALRDQGFSLRDCAVMYRTNAQSRALEEAMVRWGIPYQLVGGTRFYQRREVKDATAYLRVLANPWDSAGLERVLNVPPRGLGQRTAAELRRYARQQGLTPLQVATMAEEQEGLSVAGRARNALVAFGRLMAELAVEVEAQSPHDLLDLVLMRVGYRDYLQDHFPDADDRWENLRELHTVASGYASLPPREALSSPRALVEGDSQAREPAQRAELAHVLGQRPMLTPSVP